MDKIYYIPTKQKVLSLTADDGPTFNTSIILDILKSYQIKATFFVLTKTVMENKNILKKIIDEGHTIGLHGFDHRSLSKHDPSYIKYIIQESLTYLKKNFGVDISYIRPPFGTIPQYGDSIFKEFGLMQLGWCVMTKDWYTKFIEDKYKEIVSNCQPGKIIVMHDGLRTNSNVATGAPKVLELVVPHLVEQQFSFVDIPTLINSYDHSIPTRIGRHTLFSARQTIVNNILNLDLFWDMTTVKPNQEFQIKVVSENHSYEPVIAPFPNPTAMKEWFPTYEIELEPFTKLVDVYIKTKRNWVKLSNP